MPKTHNNLWPQIANWENVHAAYMESVKGKRYHFPALKIRAGLEECLVNVLNHLVWDTWNPGPFRSFYVYEPKRRLIHAPALKDRIVHHAIVRVIEPLFEQKFIYDSYACRRGKGTQRAVNRLQGFLRRAQGIWGRVYVLKADISKYFASVPSDKLICVLARTIRDKRVLGICRKIVEHGAESGRGIPVGALTSQLFANAYLDQLDHYAVGMVESSSVSFNLHAGLSFDGVDDYAQATIPSMTTGKLRFYAKVAGNMPTGCNTTLVDIGSWGSQTGWGVWINNSSNNEIGVRDSGGTYPYSTTVLPDSPYTKIEAVYDGTDILLYVNDSLVYTLSNATVNSASTVTLGRRIDNNIEWFNGIIDNLEILDLNNNLITQYKMNEGSGTTLVDSAGTYNGTIYGASWLHGLIETRTSTDDGTTWTAWATCTNGGAIPDLPYGTDVSTALLECRQSLSTSDPTVTPQLESITVEVGGEFGRFFAFPF